jgi:hypothetical protein
MRKIIWYRSQIGKPDWIPVYGNGPWWAHLLNRWLEDLSILLSDVVHNIQVKYIKEEE